MMVTVVYLERLKELMQTGEAREDLFMGDCLGSLKARLLGVCLSDDQLRSTLSAVNGEAANDIYRLSNGDEVAFFLPFERSITL